MTLSASGSEPAVEEKGAPPPRALPVGALFDMTPRLELVLGPKTYSVPPLTFGRWQRLVYAFVGKNGLLSAPPVEEKAIAFSSFFGGCFTNAAAAVIPGLAPEDWAKGRSQAVVGQLFDFFHGVHHWQFIKEMTGFGAPQDAPAGSSDAYFVDSLLVVAHETGERVAALLDTRVEGVLLLMDHTRRKFEAIRKAREESGEDAGDWVYTPAGESTADSRMPVNRDPEEYARVSALFENAPKYGPRVVGDGIEQVWETPKRPSDG